MENNKKDNFEKWNDPKGSNQQKTERENDRENQKHDISNQEIDDLEKSENDLTSDESENSGLLDDGDTEGIPLNEGPDDENLFDTGEELDVSKEDLNPDLDPDTDNI